MAKNKRMQVVVDELITGPCPECKVHAGIVAETKALCVKMDEKYERVSERIDDREKMANIQYVTLKETISVAKDVMDARLVGMNQLTHQLDLQRQETKEKMLELTGSFLPKERFDSEHKTFAVTINAKMDSLNREIKSKIESLDKDIINERIKDAALQKTVDLNTNRIAIIETSIAPLQIGSAARKEGLRWMELLLMAGISLFVFVLARLVLKI